MRQPSRATSPNDARNPSPGPRRLTKAPPRLTLSPRRGLLVPVFVDWEQSTKDGGPAPARQAKIDERSGNVIENKGQLTSAAGKREIPAPCPCGAGVPPAVVGAFRPPRTGRACPERSDRMPGRQRARRPRHNGWRKTGWNLRTIVQNIAFVQNRTQLRVREGNAECLDGENQAW